MKREGNSKKKCWKSDGKQTTGLKSRENAINDGSLTAGAVTIKGKTEVIEVEVQEITSTACGWGKRCKYKNAYKVREDTTKNQSE